MKPWNQSGKFPLCRISGAWVPVNHLSTSSFRPPSDGSSWRSTADFISILTRLSAADQHGRPALCSDYLSIERSAASFDYFHLASLFWIVVLFQFIYLSLDFLLYLCIQFIGVPCPRSTCGGHIVHNLYFSLISKFFHCLTDSWWRSSCDSEDSNNLFTHAVSSDHSTVSSKWITAFTRSRCTTSTEDIDAVCITWGQ